MPLNLAKGVLNRFLATPTVLPDHSEDLNPAPTPMRKRGEEYYLLYDTIDVEFLLDSTRMTFRYCGEEVAGLSVTRIERDDTLHINGLRGELKLNLTPS